MEHSLFRPDLRPFLPRHGPRLALVIGSGGVRGAAAIGVADVLRREGLAPDLIVGCSSGALFGAVIALGLPVEEQMRRITTLWSDDLTRERRWRAWAELVAPRWFRFGPDFSLRGARGMAAAVEQGFGSTRFELLNTPLRVAATEAATGMPVTLTSGRVADAVRASMAVPFLFPPVSIGGRRLVDGVLSDPLPLAAAADAQAVIALGFDGSLPRRIDRPSRLAAQVATTMINNLTQSRREAARASGLRIVDLELALERKVGLWETRAIPAMFEAGRRAATLRLPQIAALLA